MGLTGTPFRKEHRELWGLRNLYGPPVYPDHKKIETATDVHGRKVLATVKPELFKTGYDIKLDEQTLLAEELNDQALRKFNNDSRNETIATHWNKNAELF